LSAACLLNTTQGGKPSGGGGGDTGGGTIYFVRNPGGFSTMDSNGGSKTSLGINPGEPSYALHGGQRWFLQTRQLPGEFYPNGSTRRELVAVSGDGGQAVQLTDQPSLEVRGQVRGYHWTPGDEAVSWTARRWDVSTGNVVEGGIYGAGISFGADGPVLLAQPANPLLPVELIVTQGSWEAYEDGPTLAPNVNTHSWSPLAVFVVYDLLDWQARESWIADPVTGAEFQLSANGVHPEWSPDGGKIAFDGFHGHGVFLRSAVVPHRQPSDLSRLRSLVEAVGPAPRSPLRLPSQCDGGWKDEPDERFQLRLSRGLALNLLRHTMIQSDILRHTNPSTGETHDD
jgi:hypothetical protein